MTDMLALFVIRLSQLSDVTTSPERQCDHCDRWANAHGATKVGQAVDLGVSGALSPFDRPELGPWLTDNPPKPWTVLVAWRLDRVGRNALDTLVLLQWLEARGKRLVTVADNLDSSGPYAKAFITLAAVFAEMARTASLEMSADARAKLVSEGKWVGGSLNHGYRVGDDNRLEVDPAAAKDIQRIFELARTGKKAADIAREMGPDWRDQRIMRIIHNVAYVGLGTPPAPAIVSPEVFEAAQRPRRTPARSESAELSGVICCLVCEHPMWVQRQSATKQYYYCKTRSHSLNIRLDVAAELAVIEFVSAFGADRVFDEIIHPDTTDAEAALCRVELAALAGQLAYGDRDALLARMSGLSAKLTELEKRATVERVERVDTGRTWAEEVDRLTLAELGDELRRRGHRIGVRKTSHKPVEIKVRVLAAQGLPAD